MWSAAACHCVTRSSTSLWYVFSWFLTKLSRNFSVLSSCPTYAGDASWTARFASVVFCRTCSYFCHFFCRAVLLLVTRLPSLAVSADGSFISWHKASSLARSPKQDASSFCKFPVCVCSVFTSFEKSRSSFFLNWICSLTNVSMGTVMRCLTFSLSSMSFLLPFSMVFSNNTMLWCVFFMPEMSSSGLILAAAFSMSVQVDWWYLSK
mmetsp:Transcript_44464/g.87076  ORF Transcript_44464/g.87076 Transcript_44464/m.87076 type:complete len:207 (+) Transcript_44464:317-937(+)